jgi:hypothetical protein
MAKNARVGNYGRSRPVFLITFRDRTNLVVKGEMNARRQGTGQQSLKWEGKMMRQVSPPVKINLLKEDEIRTLNELQEVVFAYVPFGSRSRVPPVAPSIARAYLVDLIDSGLFLFYKMPYLEGLHDGDLEKKDEEGKIRFYQTLCKPSVLREMGRVIAADLFNGNNDRFNSKTGRLNNASNLILQRMQDGTDRIIGLDFYQTDGEGFCDLYKPIPTDWGGYHLRTPETRAAFAQMVVEGLTEHFLQNSDGLGYVLGLEFDGSHAWQILNGMNEGVELMKSYLNRRYSMGKPVNSAIRDRARLLGWIT